MNSDWKDNLASKFVESPLAHSLVRLFLFQVWFRLGVLGIISLVVLLGILPLKIWRTSPADFSPRIRVSALDLVQAWSLKRAALRAAAQNRGEEALDAWQYAVAKNPAEASLVRGFLNELLRRPPAKKDLAVGVSETRWLLRLSRTNRADLELAARVFSHYRVEVLLPSMLEPLEDRLSPELEAAYLKALVQQGAVEKFAQCVDRYRRRGHSFANEDLELDRAAYLAGWGSPTAASEGRHQLALAFERPLQQTLACRLQMAVSAHLDDLERYREMLEWLEQKQEDRLRDHIGYWQMLAARGRKAEVTQLLQSYSNRPVFGFEAVWLLQWYSNFGLRDEVLVLARQFTSEFNFYEPIWLARADLLLEQRRWDELDELALAIRTHHACAGSLTGFSIYLDGRVDLAQHRHRDALAAFQKACAVGFENKKLALTVAGHLLTLGYGQLARDLLAPLKPDLKNDSDYWQLLLTIAYELKDSDLLATAAAGAYALAPDDAVAINNYAASLVINRQHPAEAVKHTWQLTRLMPASSSARINHALALLQNKRVAEAEHWIGTLPPEQLTASEATLCHLAQFEIHLLRRQFLSARQIQARIDPQFLFPNQKAWLRDSLAQMPAGDQS